MNSMVVRRFQLAGCLASGCNPSVRYEFSNRWDARYCWVLGVPGHEPSDHLNKLLLGCSWIAYNGHRSYTWLLPMGNSLGERLSSLSINLGWFRSPKLNESWRQISGCHSMGPWQLWVAKRLAAHFGFRRSTIRIHTAVLCPASFLWWWFLWQWWLSRWPRNRKAAEPRKWINGLHMTCAG